MPGVFGTMMKQKGLTFKQDVSVTKHLTLHTQQAEYSFSPGQMGVNRFQAVYWPQWKIPQFVVVTRAVLVGG